MAQKPPRSKPRGQETGTPKAGSTAGNPGGDASGGADGGGSGSGGGVIAGSGSGTAGEMGSSGMGSGGMISGSGMPGAAPGSGGRSGGTPGMGMPSMPGGMPGMSGAPGSDGMVGGATDNTSSKFVVPEGPIPDWLASGQKEREACETIRTQLRKKTNFVFEDVPLETALEQISKELGTPIIMNSYVQSQNLENVNYSGPDLPTRLTLRMILEGNNLAYVVKPECIEIQIQGDEEACSMRFYDLAYVIDSADQTRAISRGD